MVHTARWVLANVTALFPAPRLGGARGVWHAAMQAQQRGTPAALALVLETQGSTYVPAGAVALFMTDNAAAEHQGWLSGGCLEPDIALHAARSVRQQTLEFITIDTLDDSAFFSSAATGCRGRMLIALLPLGALAPIGELLAHWHKGAALHIALTPSGALTLRCGAVQTLAHLALGAPYDSHDVDFSHPFCVSAWQLTLAPPVRVALFGAGPEYPALVSQFRALGFYMRVIEPRPRWQRLQHWVDEFDAAPNGAALGGFDAVLVMQHSFELDLDALRCVAHLSNLENALPRYIGLLGPRQRRMDLCKLLTPDERAAVEPLLHGPVGLDLGGYGAEAIALSIAAQLQQQLASAVRAAHA
jgi:xanthine dehydrogenase accessory factor